MEATHHGGMFSVTILGAVMGKSVATMVIEPRSLVREALVSLITRHSYHIVGNIASTADIAKSSNVAEAPRLVILGALPVDDAASAAVRIRRLWPEAKIILLFDDASSGDFQKVLASEIDGCIPLRASPDTLLDTLGRIIVANLRILVLKTATCSSTPCAATRDEDSQLAVAPYDPIRCDDVADGVVDCAASLRLSCGLSQREEEILKCVVRGHSNKMIARTCGVTDATIKVHMKSILRKIRVVNRTQAAIWALERGYGGEVNRRPLAPRPSPHGLAVA